ncbi:MAG TPA: hypothetical protein VG125_26345 [Pirellulales bacterium]|nr:hypothetical protein [Pirellulales bacterium]
MGGLHFSLRWMFGLVSFLAVGCGLLIYATPFLSRLTLTVTLVLLLASVLAAACHTGERRMFWAGFAFFGLAYGWIVCGSWQSPANDGLLHHRLATTAILEWCHERAPRTRSFTTQSPGSGMMGMGSMGGTPMGGPMGGGPMGGGPMGGGPMGGGPMGGPMSGGPMGGSGGPPAVTIVSQTPDVADFAATGHSLFALAFAMLGGLIATGCYKKAKPKASG